MKQESSQVKSVRENKLWHCGKHDLYSNILCLLRIFWTHWPVLPPRRSLQPFSLPLCPCIYLQYKALLVFSLYPLSLLLEKKNVFDLAKKCGAFWSWLCLYCSWCIGVFWVREQSECIRDSSVAVSAFTKHTHRPSPPLHVSCSGILLIIGLFRNSWHCLFDRVWGQYFLLYCSAVPTYGFTSQVINWFGSTCNNLIQLCGPWEETWMLPLDQLACLNPI